MDFIFGFFIFVAVIAISAVLFGGWVIYAFTRMIVRLVSAGRPTPKAISGKTIVCARTRCNSVNPAHARFCRRCGQAMPRRFEYAATRRAACW